MQIIWKFKDISPLLRFVWSVQIITDRPQFLLLILSTFKQIKLTSIPPEIIRKKILFSDYFRRYRS